jgi:hypothetical protein
MTLDSARWELQHHRFLALPETLNTSYGFVAVPLQLMKPLSNKRLRWDQPNVTSRHRCC